MSSENNSKSIAVVGVSLRLPGASTLDELWNNLANGVSSIAQVNTSRWSQSSYLTEDDLDTISKTSWGGFVDDIEQFDARFFNISPREAGAMDPQQRVVLELAWGAIEDAGYKASDLSGSNTGVFIGVCHADYTELHAQRRVNIDSYYSTGIGYSIIANRVSFFFNFSGPSVVNDTACASSLVAVEQAFDAIHNGRCDIALAGGVNFCWSPTHFVAFTRNGMLSKEGKSKTFDQSADGYVRGEGGSIIVLRPLDKAIADNDHIYGLIKGVSSNHGGHTNSLTVTSAHAQAQLISSVVERSGVAPETISYIETHGSGTPLGDPIEVQGIKLAFQDAYIKKSRKTTDWDRCGLGSIKTNIGHLESAAGIASIVKVLACFKNKKLLPNINFSKLNGLIDLDGTPFYVVDKLAKWEPRLAADPIPRRAGVSSFGFGGVNAHAILEEYSEEENERDNPNTHDEHCILLSTKESARLGLQATRLANYIKMHNLSDIDLPDIAYTLQLGREAFEHRLAFVAHNIGELISTLEAIASGTMSEHSVYQGRADIKNLVKPVCSEKVMAQAIEKRDYNRLLSAWIDGVSVNWQALHSKARRKVSLPTYPFNRKKHWFEENESARVPVVECNTHNEEHALLPSIATPLELSADEEDIIRSSVQQKISQLVSHILKLDEDEFAIDQEFGYLGFESISFSEFAIELNKYYQSTLRPTVFFEHSTIDALSEYILSKFHALVLAKHAESLTDELHSCNYPVSRFSSDASSNNKVPVNTSQINTDIAIIGVSGRFPGAKDIEEFWQVLSAEKDCIDEVPKARWDWRDIFDDPAKGENKTNIKWGGFIDDVDKFDPLFFGISPVEARVLDPQQRLLLEHVWQALEDAGYAPSSLAGSNTAILVGCQDSGYLDLVVSRGVDLDGYSATSKMPSVGPNRVSHILDLHGISEPVDTACSSALVAIHRAAELLLSDKADLAIAGGINTILTPEYHIYFSKAGMLCEDGRCKTFSDQANGYVRGEGVGILVLKPFAQAVNDGDHIHGKLIGSGVNHGGRTNSLTAPSTRAQANLIQSVYQKAGIDPQSITYVEAHGSGTPLGDPIEINALKSAFNSFDQDVEQHARCGVGTVKTNIGHLEFAAGVAGVVKVLLQFKHRTLVKSLHSENLNPYIELDDSPFYIVQNTRPWKSITAEDGIEMPRRAAVSSFGFGGVNAHVVLEEYIPEDGLGNAENVETDGLLLLSAKTQEQLKEQAENLLSYVQSRELRHSDLKKLCYTLQVGRDAMAMRAATTVHSVEALIEKLTQFVSSPEPHSDWVHGVAKNNQTGSSTVQRYFSQGQFNKLLELWVKGVTIDWRLLYQAGAIPGRMSLPTYPFARERHWVDKPYQEPRWEMRQLIPKWRSLTQSNVNAPISKVSHWQVVLCRTHHEHTSVPWFDSALKEKLIAHTRDMEVANVSCELLDGASADIVASSSLLIEQVFLRLHAHLKNYPRDHSILQVVIGSELSEGVLQSLSGLLATAQIENPKLRTQLIQISPDYSIENLGKVLKDELSSEAELRSLVRYDGPHRQGIEWERAKDCANHVDSPWQNDGVYLITGGMGGLGKLVTETIAKEAPQARIILTGRTEPTEATQTQLKKLYGKRVEYVSADVCNRSSLNALMAHIKSNNGRLTGIIHAAGLIRDNYIINKSVEELRQVLAPKITGLVNLDEASAEFDLSLFVCFSSVMSLGNAGQADYAAANGFMDAYMQYRKALVNKGQRRGKSISFNWTLMGKWRHEH